MNIETCESEIDDCLNRVIQQIRKIANKPQALKEYSLCYDYSSVPEDHICWLLSYGGPQQEFRIYFNDKFEIIKIEFWYLDWHDASKREIQSDSLCYYLIEQVFESYGGKYTAKKLFDKYKG